jgi:hypothetical protein
MDSPFLVFARMVLRDVGSLFTSLSFSRSHAMTGLETYVPPLAFTHYDAFSLASEIALAIRSIAREVTEVRGALRGRIGISLEDSMGVVAETYGALTDASAADLQNMPRADPSSEWTARFRTVLSVRARPSIDPASVAEILRSTHELELDGLLALVVHSATSSDAGKVWRHLAEMFADRIGAIVFGSMGYHGGDFQGRLAASKAPTPTEFEGPAVSALRECVACMLNREFGLHGLARYLWMGGNSPNYRGYDAIVDYSPYDPKTHGLPSAADRGWSLFVVDGFVVDGAISGMRELQDSGDGRELMEAAKDAAAEMKLAGIPRAPAIGRPSSWIAAFERVPGARAYDGVAFAEFMRRNFYSAPAVVMPPPSLVPPRRLAEPEQPKGKRHRPHTEPDTEEVWIPPERHTSPADRGALVIRRMRDISTQARDIRVKLDSLLEREWRSDDESVRFGLFVAACSQEMRRLVMDVASVSPNLMSPKKFQLPMRRVFSDDLREIKDGSLYGFPIAGVPGNITLALVATSHVEGTRAIATCRDSIAGIVAARIGELSREGVIEKKNLGGLDSLRVPIGASESIVVRIGAAHFTACIVAMLDGRAGYVPKTTIADSAAEFERMAKESDVVAGRDIRVRRALLGLDWRMFASEVEKAAARLGDPISAKIAEYVRAAQSAMVDPLERMSPESVPAWLAAVTRFPTFPEFSFGTGRPLPFDVGDSIYPRSLLGPAPPATSVAPAPAPPATPAAPGYTPMTPLIELPPETSGEFSEPQPELDPMPGLLPIEPPTPFEFPQSLSSQIPGQVPQVIRMETDEPAPSQTGYIGSSISLKGRDANKSRLRW